MPTSTHSFSGSGLLVIILASLAAVSQASVDIKLKPFVGPEEIESDGFIIFEPYEPTPTVETSCYDECPCGGGLNETDCGCDVEPVCGGSIPVDLSSNEVIRFHWYASTNDTKYISVQGSSTIKVEFQAKYDCEGNPGVVDIAGSDIQFEIDDEGVGTSSQKYVYNAESSFVQLGKCDGCGSCEIFTRLRFEPVDGELSLSLKSLLFFASYDPSQIILQGEYEYEWATDGYCWMRLGDNTYEILDLPEIAPSTTELSTTSGSEPEDTTPPSSAATTAASSARVIIIFFSVFLSVRVN